MTESVKTDFQVAPMGASWCSMTTPAYVVRSTITNTLIGRMLIFLFVADLSKYALKATFMTRMRSTKGWPVKAEITVTVHKTPDSAEL